MRSCPQTNLLFEASAGGGEGSGEALCGGNTTSAASPSTLRMAYKKHPDNKMFGRCKAVDGKAGEYKWMTYKQVYDVMKLSASIRSCVEKGGHCGIFGINSPEWVMSMEACNALGAYCVPLYDTLGAGAVEFVICHAEVQIVCGIEKDWGVAISISL